MTRTGFEPRSIAGKLFNQPSGLSTKS